MKRLSIDLLKQDNARHAGSGGVSEGNRDLGFRPAFFDYATGATYLSRYRDGREAPFHMLDGLPESAVVTRLACGRVVAAKATLVSGFERHGYFYTRRAAARAVLQWTLPPVPGQMDDDDA